MMHNEIQIALEFLVSFLHNKIPKSKICTFSRHLTTHLLDRFQGHWYPDRPHKGSAFRCLTLGKTKMDDVVKRACTDAGLDPDQLRETLTSDVSIWVDPDEVSYRIGEGGPVKTLINFAMASSGSSPTHGSTPPALGEGGYYTPMSGAPGPPPPAGYDYQDYSINGGVGEELFSSAPLLSAEGLVTYHQAGPSPQQHYYSNHKQQHGFRGQQQVGRHQGGMVPPPPYLALTPPPPFQHHPHHHYTNGQVGPKFMGGGSAGPHHPKYGYHHFSGRGAGGKRGGGPPKQSSISPPFYQHPAAPRNGHNLASVGSGSGLTRRGITFSPPNLGYFNDSSSPDDFYPIATMNNNSQQGFNPVPLSSSSSSQTVYFNTTPPVGASKGAFVEDFYHDRNNNTQNYYQAQSQASPTSSSYNYDNNLAYGGGGHASAASSANSESSNANSASPPSSASFDLRSNGLNSGGLDIITNNLQQLLVAN